MIKRMNKATSLLLAAAAVASIVPQAGVMAADYTKVESEEGTIYLVPHSRHSITWFPTIIFYSIVFQENVFPQEHFICFLLPVVNL